MLQQIISHTPIYVWAILGFLVYRGVAASRDRSMSVRSVFVMPAVMLALGLQSMAGGFGLASPAAAAWLVGLAGGTGLAWLAAGAGRGGDNGFRVDRAAGTVWLRGSWAPLAMMLAIFVAKFAFAVALATHPAWRASLAFALPACAAFGALSGSFMGRPLKVAAALRAAPVGAAAGAAV